MPHYENVPFDIPDSWEWTKLCDVTSIIGDGLHGTPQYDDKGSYYFINGNNLQSRKIVIMNETKKVSEEEYKKYQKPLNNRTILVSINGTIGNIGTYNDERVILGKSACFFNISQELFKEYVCIIIESHYFLKYAVESATGSTIKNVPLKAINNFLIPIPPITEQARIVSEFNRWIAIIDNLETSKQNLQTAIRQAKSKTLELAIHGKLVPQDPNDEPASELLKRINPKAQITCDNEHYPQLPKGWAVTSMQEVCSLLDGEKQNNRSLINLDVKFLRGNSKGIAINAGKYVPANTYMILVDGENSGEVFKAPIDGYQGSTFKQLSINENMNEKFVLHIINLHGKALRENKVGSAIPHLNKKLFKVIPVPIPPYAEQERIVVAINAAYALLTVIEESL